MPGERENPERWSSEDKFAVVVETVGMNESAFSEYYRHTGLYADQIASWRCVCESQRSSEELKKAQRWERSGGLQDRWQQSKQELSNKFTVEECKQIVKVCNRPELAAFRPSHIVPVLADTGEYIASELTFNRVLRESDQVQHIASPLHILVVFDRCCHALFTYSSMPATKTQNVASARNLLLDGLCSLTHKGNDPPGSICLPTA